MPVIKDSSLHKVNSSDIQPIDYSIEGQTFNYGLHENLKIKLLGGHQLKMQ